MPHFSVLFGQLAKQPPPLLRARGEFKNRKVQSLKNYEFFHLQPQTGPSQRVDLTQFSFFTTARCLEEVNTVYHIDAL